MHPIDDAKLMEAALAEASAAAEEGEVPVGAVVVNSDGEIIARAHNRAVGLCDPSAHAEILALRAAGERAGNYRLPDCDLCVTLEPCAMCVGAIVHARIRRLIYGAPDPKGGAVESTLQLLDSSHWNHKVEVVSGLFAEEAAVLLRDFFAKRRGKQRPAGR